MLWEMIIGGIVFYCLFGNYIGAKAEEIRERTRGLEIDNDMKDALHHQGDEHEEGV